MRIAMLSPRLPPWPCGVGDHAQCLARSLTTLGHEVALLSFSRQDGAPGFPGAVSVSGPPCTGKWALRLARSAAATGSQLLHYHYVPFLYGRRGLSLGAATLPLWARRAGLRTVITLHELAMPWSRQPGRAAVAALQRLQLALLVVGSDGVIVTTGHREALLRRWFPWRSSHIHRVPVGSTIEVDTEVDREAVRGELGLSMKVVLGFFGTTHPSKDVRLMARCLAALAADGIDASMIWIGVERGDLAGLLAELGDLGAAALARSVCTGWVPDRRRVSHLLSAVDIYLLPLVDGVSTLRTTAMVAMAHGLASVGTVGRETDPEFFGAETACLVPVGDEEGFCRVVVALARDPARRAILGREARSVFSRSCSWPRLAEATLAVYGRAMPVLPTELVGGASMGRRDAGPIAGQESRRQPMADRSGGER